MVKNPAYYQLPGLVEKDNFSFEQALFRQGFRAVAGTDEAGRGPLAGPVVAAAVILPRRCKHHIFLDSKVLNPERRQELLAELHKIKARIGVGICDVPEIDRLNILQASLLAMRKGLEALPVPADFVLVDGKFPVSILLPQQTLIRGERRSASIAAASIVAKEVRDRLMEEYHQCYPQYNFVRHKGYPTAEHRRLLKEYGPCRIHRRTFKGVREYLPDSDDGC
jgi:ribonuclease HII